MLQIVAERGYGAVTVRELARVASVSSRAFYQRYSSKEECFLCTHEMVVDRIVHLVNEAQADEVDRRIRLRVAIDVFLGELQREPDAANMLLIASYVAGPMALEQVRRAEQQLGATIARCFDSEMSYPAIPMQLSRGVIVGIMCVARSWLFTDSSVELSYLGNELTDWTASVFRAFKLKTELVQSTSEPHDIAVRITPSSGGNGVAPGDRALILSALFKLSASESYEELTESKIRESAGASSNKFKYHFGGVADCFEEATRLYARGVVSRLDLQANGSSSQRVNETITFLCQWVARDSQFTTLCFVDVFGPGLASALVLDRFIGEIADLLSESVPRQDPDPSPALRAGAAAVWGVIREEVLGSRRSRLPEIAPLLSVFGAAEAVKSDSWKTLSPKI
jgi:AcrR family transcriptional regulator